MNIGTIEILCDHIENVTPVTLRQDAPKLRLLLDDVDACSIMRQLVANLDNNDLLDYFNDKDIIDYLVKQREPKLSPRDECINAFLNAEKVEIKI